MVDVLQKFEVVNSGAMTPMLIVIALTWLIWPVLCGVLGARRGQAASGVFHGLMWGPFGLLPVLLSRPRFQCPTCRQRTLRAPMDETPPMARAVTPPGAGHAVRPVVVAGVGGDGGPRVTAVANAPHGVEQARSVVHSARGVARQAGSPRHDTVVEESPAHDAGASEERRLLAWVNAESDAPVGSE